MTTAQLSVKNWHLKAGLPAPEKPTIPDVPTRLLRARLIFEEALETIWEGLGVQVNVGINDSWMPVEMNTVDFRPYSEPDLVKLADGMADTNYVINGTAVSCGIDLEPVDAEVCRSNDTKFKWSVDEINDALEMGWIVYNVGNGESCVKDQNGKIRKPADSYSPANIKAVIERQLHPALITIKGVETEGK